MNGCFCLFCVIGKHAVAVKATVPAAAAAQSGAPSPRDLFSPFWLSVPVCVVTGCNVSLLVGVSTFLCLNHVCLRPRAVSPPSVSGGPSAGRQCLTGAG